jgi:short-subunit dehydrogenase
MKNPKTILITGASSGIGRALALLYAAPGMRLLLAGRDETRLSETAGLCAAKGAAVETSLVPVNKREAFEAVILSWDDRFAVDLVVANAGISGGPAGDAAAVIEPEEQFRRLIDVNLGGIFNTVNPLLPRLLARKKGQVALVSSMAGLRGMPNAPAYSTSKMAVRAYGEALRPLLKKQGVEVSVIFPGFVRTPLTAVNDFPMPFMIGTEAAARHIRQGLERNKARIAFPWQMYALTRLVAALPLCLGDFILSKAPKKK